MDRFHAAGHALDPLSTRAVTARLIQSRGSTMSLSTSAMRSPEVVLMAASRLKLASRTPGGVSSS